MNTFIKLLLLAVVITLLAFTPVTTPSITGVWTTLCQTQTSLYKNIGFKVHNTGSNPFTACQVQVWVGPASTDWMTYYTWPACSSLAAGAMATFEFEGNSNEQFRIQAQSAAGTSAYCRPYGN